MNVSAEPRFEFAQQRALIVDNLDHGDRQREVGDTVDLRKDLAPSRSRRPLDLECVAGERRQIEIGFECPGVHQLPALLPYRRQRDEVTGGGEISLLGEFALCRGEEVAAGAGLGEALRDRPRTGVFFCPKQTAWVRQQDFERVPLAEREETGTDLCTAAHPRIAPKLLRLSTAGLAKEVVVCMILSRLRPQ